ncbi:endonuclease/exonuclease/phosphatase family protein [Brevundimonas sp.]|uniref:endonuclease/exonuclease/phosphatase family protein n=1 Tax=Brevundimonas sp. TaxID=1871086 RepID=UPI0035B1F265
MSLRSALLLAGMFLVACSPEAQSEPPVAASPASRELAAQPGPAAIGQEAPPIRVMSYNIRVALAQDTPSWPERRPHLAAQIRRVDPDILGVQESKRQVVRWLGRQLPGFESYGLGRDDSRTAESATLLWRTSRFEALERQTLWCSPTPDRPSKGWDSAYPRTITRVLLRDRADGQMWDVRNTHFDHEGEEARLQCARILADLPVADGAVEVALGDFNTGPGTAPYRRIVEGGLADARRVSPRVAGPEGTFNGFDIRRTDGEAIDHIFVGDGVEVLNFSTLTDSFDGRVISDHFPLVAEIEAED